MDWAVFLPFLLKVLPTLLSIIEQIVAMAHDKQMLDQGRLEAIADAAAGLNKRIAAAADAAQQQERRNTQDSSDAAFPPKMWRD